MIEIRLFGDLQRYASNSTAPSGTAMQLAMGEQETVGQVLARMGIGLEDVGNIFLNGRLLPRSVYPITLGYQLAAPGPLAPEEYLGISVQPGDRLGIFPRNMASVVV